MFFDILSSCCHHCMAGCVRSSLEPNLYEKPLHLQEPTDAANAPRSIIDHQKLKMNCDIVSCIHAQHIMCVISSFPSHLLQQ